jgi:O-antigen/teichoic acid export membrane protein
MKINPLYKFYLPLALTAVMMNVTTPVLNSVISRHPASIIQLAAFAASFAIATLTHSPVFSVQQIAISKADSKYAFWRISKIFFVIMVPLMALNFFIATSELGNIIFERVIGTTAAVATAAKYTIMAFLPLPLFILFRGSFQGILIRAKKTAVISIATLVRLIALFFWVGLFIIMDKNITSAVAGAGLTLAVFIETFILFLAVVPLWKYLPSKSNEQISRRNLMRFSWPLIISMVLWTSSGFFINAIVGHSLDRDAAIAITGVIYASIGWFMAAPAKPLMQMVMVYGDDQDMAGKVRVFAAQLTAVLTGILLLLNIPFVREYIFTVVFHIDPIYWPVAENVLWLIPFYPFVIALRAYLQGELVRLESTRPVSTAAGIRMLLLAISVFISLNLTFQNGAFAGVLILIVSIVIENAFLYYTLQKRTEGKAFG